MCKAKTLSALSYSSVKLVKVDARQHFWPCLLFRLIQIGLFVYVIIFTIILKKAYNEQEAVSSSVYTKMKGAGTSIKKSRTDNTTTVNYIDVIDIVQPPLMSNSLFLTTCEVVNKEEQGTTCSDPKTKCKTASDCKEGTYPIGQNAGMLTGTCTAGHCEVRGWCAEGNPPYDEDDACDVLYTGISNMSLFVRINAEFTVFGKTLNTAKSKRVKGLNQWLVGDILEEAGVNYHEAERNGAVILMQAKYDCDFNTWPSSDACEPDWQFSRLDNPTGFSKGFNYYQSSGNNNGTRTVTKRYGLKIEISVSGTAGRFSAPLTGIALGAGLGLLSIAAVVTDFLLQYVFKSQNYLSHKWDVLDPSDADAEPSDLPSIFVRESDGLDDLIVPLHSANR